LFALDSPLLVLKETIHLEFLRPVPLLSEQKFAHAREWCHASIKVFATEILPVCFLPALVSLLDIYSEPPDSIPPLLLFSASL
jgi:hypothetical protein